MDISRRRARRRQGGKPAGRDSPRNQNQQRPQPTEPRGPRSGFLHASTDGRTGQNWEDGRSWTGLMRFLTGHGGSFLLSGGLNHQPTAYYNYMQSRASTETDGVGSPTVIPRSYWS